MLELKNIDVVFGTGTNDPRIILNELNFKMRPGEFVMLIGGNGAGKSTLLNVISGYQKPASGQVIIAGKDVTQMSQVSRSLDISMVMQDPRVGTMENMTIFENMAFACQRGGSRAFLPFATHRRRAVFCQKLSLLGLGLEDRLDERVAVLSGGQRQALSLVMAILSESKILLLDEITGALDPKMAEVVMGISEAIIRSEGKASLMITHNMAHAITYGDRLVILKDGQIAKEFGPLDKQRLTLQDLQLV